MRIPLLLQDTFLTSWSSERGYHLFVWEKTFFMPYLIASNSFEEAKEVEMPANSE